MDFVVRFRWLAECRSIASAALQVLSKLWWCTIINLVLRFYCDF
jgi:hypothetical protein